jgi:uncharacterized membrane protein
VPLFDVQHSATTTSSTIRKDMILRGAVWVLFAALLLRFICLWANAFGHLSLPVPRSIGFTIIFSAFSIAHAASELGWRKALAFLSICAAVSWCFETVGVSTGLVYGAYHYSSRLGVKLGSVPIIIPLAWFMMVYASSVVARLLLQGLNDPLSRSGAAVRVVIAAMTMTAWDTVMDPGKASSGVWTWEDGGVYFGVPLHNFLGWIATTIVIYSLTELAFRRMQHVARGHRSALYSGLPVLVYALVAIDSVLLPSIPALRVVAMFGMGFIALLAVARLAGCGNSPAAESDSLLT